MFLRLFFLFLFSLVAVGCVSFPGAPLASVSPDISDARLTSIDGAELGLSSWQADDPRAVIIAVHGMNDYAHTFSLPGAWWASEARITTYAYDQRGFGRSPAFGRWPGRETMVADLRAALVAVRARHPGLPVYVLGHSMGAAVIITGEAAAPLGADGLILAAPGVWGGSALPIPYRLSVNIAASVAPGKTLTGERAGRQATDNIEILREMYNDPRVVKETRLDSILGVVRVMGAAYAAADEIDTRSLFLMGEKDEVIPLKAMEKTAMRLSGDVTVRRYPEGWHLLFRDLQGPAVWRDVADWVLKGLVAAP